MATIQIDNLPDDLLNHIQYLAAENHLTPNETVIHLLQQAVQPKSVNRDREQQMEALQRIRSRTRVNPAHVGLSDSTVLIREDRSR